MDLKTVAQKVGNTGIGLAVFVSHQFFETDALTFLKFASADLQEPPPRGIVNALGNAKRAVENRVDSLLYAYGMNAHDKRDSWTYPAKAKKLRQAGIPVRDVLQNMIVFVRNDLEHEYKIPEKQIDVKNCVDIAELFLLATDDMIERGLLRWVVGPRKLPPSFDPSTCKVTELPTGTYGIMVDYPKQTISYMGDNTTEAASILDFDASHVADLFRVLYASVERGKTTIQGPITEASFVASFM